LKVSTYFISSWGFSYEYSLAWSSLSSAAGWLSLDTGIKNVCCAVE
jgi:hypothetical protein